MWKVDSLIEIISDIFQWIRSINLFARFNRVHMFADAPLKFNVTYHDTINDHKQVRRFHEYVLEGDIIPLKDRLYDKTNIRDANTLRTIRHPCRNRNEASEARLPNCAIHMYFKKSVHKSKRVKRLATYFSLFIKTTIKISASSYQTCCLKCYVA